MAAPPSYFAHEPKIKSHGQMMETLKARAAGASPQAKLSWNKPVRQENGSGYQTAAGTDYVVRKTLGPKDVWMYWAWHDKKLLGYSTDIEIAKTHCEAHHLGGTGCGT
jgi:hypothetical protein